MKIWISALLLVLTMGSAVVSAKESRLNGDPKEIARAMEDVLRQREYSWRAPREKSPTKETSVFKESLDQFFKMISTGMKDFFKWLGHGLEWFFKNLLPERHLKAASSPGGLGLDGLMLVAWVLITSVLCVLAVWAFRLVQRARQRQRDAPSPTSVFVPNLEKDEVSGEELPVSGWLTLATEFLSKKEYRLALRAYYLASLAELGTLGMLKLKKYKSNRDYEAELTKRASGRLALLSSFKRQGLVFDSSWYGEHPVDETLAKDFAGLHAEVMKNASSSH